MRAKITGYHEIDDRFNEWRHLLGKAVNVKLEEKTIGRGRLLGFGSDGSFELESENGSVHWYWPSLTIYEFPQGQTETEGE